MTGPGPQHEAGPAGHAGPEPAGRAGPEPAGRAGPVITLLSRPGCHLCDDARAVIAKVAADLGARWQERDITRSDSDLRAYGDMVPVTLIDGEQHDFWRVSEQRLRTALGALPGPGLPQTGKDPAKHQPTGLSDQCKSG
jgi:Glutaredoxin-like domain (DUF836)